MTTSLTNAPLRRAASKSRTLVPALLLATGSFLSQSHLLPMFGWSFLLLTVAWMLTKAFAPTQPKRIQFSNLQWALIMLPVAYLSAVVITSTRMDSIGYFLSSMACAILAVSITRRWPELMYLAVRFFLMLNVVFAVVDVIAITLFNTQGLFFVRPYAYDDLRFRGLSLEPNHLGLSLNAIYIIVLFSPRRHMPWKRGEFAFTLASIWGLAVLTFSLFTLPCLVLTTLVYGWTTRSRKIKCGILIVIVAFFYLSSSRFQSTVAGEDNSANLRTWGSLVIAQAQVEKCGLAGCGLGSARSVLRNEPQMADFAAHESLSLPNLFAGALVEGGYFFALFFLLVIFFASMPIGYGRSGNSWRCWLASFQLLFLSAMSGSHPYDAQFWSIVGLLYVLVRTDPNATHHQANRYRPLP